MRARIPSYPRGLTAALTMRTGGMTRLFGASLRGIDEDGGAESGKNKGLTHALRALDIRHQQRQIVADRGEGEGFDAEQYAYQQP